MPKKFVGENSKAVEARARKSAIADEKKAVASAAAEDERWADDDKQANKKQQRKVCVNCDADQYLYLLCSSSPHTTTPSHTTSELVTSDRSNTPRKLRKRKGWQL